MKPLRRNSGSSSYVAPENEKDTQLNYALDLLRDNKSVDTETKKKAEANEVSPRRDLTTTNYLGGLNSSLAL